MTFLEKLLRSKAFIVTLIVLPGLWPIMPYLQHNDTVLADPLKYLLHHLGFVACLLLATVLTFTPLRVLWPKWGVSQALNRHRRLIGVSAFVYAALHFTTHLLYEGGLSEAAATLATDIKKPFLLTGLLAFTILLILSITSLHAAVRWLGGKRWKNLHRLVYVAAALVAYHQATAQKLIPAQVWWIFVPLALLELARIFKQRQPKPLSPARPAVG